MNSSLRRNQLYFREDRKEELFSDAAEKAKSTTATELVILEDGRSHCLICDKHYPDANLGRSHVMRTHLAPAVGVQGVQEDPEEPQLVHHAPRPTAQPQERAQRAQELRQDRGRCRL